jgi:2,4-dienoyl-CoA reductase (NADPH2)
MATRQSIIFEPFQIGSLLIKNRILRSSLSARVDNYDGSGTQWRINFEKTFAEGGAGALISSHVPIDLRGRVLPNYAFIDHDDKIPFWAELGKQVRAASGDTCKYFLQISYSGRQQDIAGIENWRSTPLSSTSKGDYFQGIRGRAMDVDEIRAMVRKFVDAAVRVQKAGLDGIELHSGNGYLFTQFLSPAINDRVDAYGGSLANRFRFLREVIEGIRAEPSLAGIPLIVKLSGFDHNNAIYPWKGRGTDISESVQVAKWSEDAGASAIHVSSGSMFPHPWNPAGYMPTDMARRTYGGVVDSGSMTLLIYLMFRFLPAPVRLVWERALRRKLYRSFGDYLRGRQRPFVLHQPPDPDDPPAWHLIEGLNRAASREIKQAVSIPVLCTGAFQSSRAIEDAINGGDCDAVTIARPLVANPTLPNDMLDAFENGKSEFCPDRPCSLCNRCLLSVLEHPFGCYDERRYPGDYDGMIEAVMKIYR